MNYLIHDADGRITQSGSCLDNTPDSAFADFDGTVLRNPPEGFGFNTHYVAGGAVHAIPARPSANHAFDYATKAWRLPDDALDKVREGKKAALREAARSAIVGGFTSSALGTPHTYPSNETDQANLIASVTASLYPALPADWTTPFLCANAAGVWDYRSHTAAQIQQVGSDGKAAILTKLIAKAELFKTAMQAQSIEAVEAVEAVSWA